MLLQLVMATALLPVEIRSSPATIGKNTITKHFVRDKWGTSGMSKNQTFFHELAIYQRLSNCSSICSMNKFVTPLISYSVAHKTLTFRKLGSTMLCEVEAMYDEVKVARWLRDLSDALTCCGVVHCDLQPKNIGVGQGKLYVFDFDMAFVSGRKKPARMGCPFDSRLVSDPTYKSKFRRTLLRLCRAG